MDNKNNNLEKLVKQRKKETETIRAKLTTTVEILGEIRNRGEWDNFTERGEYNRQELCIRHYFESRCVGCDCEIISYEENIIIYQNKKVFLEEDNTIKIYQPGDWEKLLDEAYNQALNVSEDKNE